MTGLERLRELAGGLQPDRILWYLTSTEYDRAREAHGEVHVDSTLNELLTSIADQIEAEQEERITRRLEDREAAEWVREHGGLDAVRKRLMPEGMEWLLDVWPKWSNGEYCKFGDWWKAEKYGKLKPQQLRRLVFFTPEQLREWGQDEGENFGYEWDFMRPRDTTYRPDKVEPPAPKVYDVDRVEIRIGDEVFDIETGKVHHVASIDPVGKRFKSMEQMSGDASWLDPACFTHERPDSWGRLEEDAANLDEMPCDYSAKDLVRRAKKLAGVGE